MQKLVVTIAEAVQISGISRSGLYKLFKDGRLVPRKNGKRTLILMTDLRAFIKSLSMMDTKTQGTQKMGELLKLAAPRPWAVVVDEDKTVSILDADGFEVAQLWYNLGDGPTPNRASSPFDAAVIVEAVNAYGS